MGWKERRRTKRINEIASGINAEYEHAKEIYHSRLASHPQVVQSLAKLKTFPAGSAGPLSEQVSEWERLIGELAAAETLIAHNQFRFEWTKEAYGAAGRLVAAATGRENDNDGEGSRAVTDSTIRLLEGFGENYVPFFLHAPGEVMSNAIVEGFHRTNA